MHTYDVLIIGAGAAGLMCAIESAKRGKRTIVLEHSPKIGEKIRISGGGRCNFTNLHTAPDKFLSQNPHFCRSALKRFSQQDFIDMVESHKITYHEKTLGQLFCDNSANDIIQMLLNECKANKATVQLGTSTETISTNEQGQFICKTSQGTYTTNALVIASGGLSIPKIGASPFGYQIAEQFGHTIVPPRAGLVPLTFDPHILNHTRDLSGLSVPHARVSAECGKSFDEAILFTHRGISGPAILQISSYWKTGENIFINLAPELDIFDWLKQARHTQGKRNISSLIETILPQKLAQLISEELSLNVRVADATDKLLKTVATRINNWQVKPSGSEGYRTAEVTLGGVDTTQVSSKTFESEKQKNLFFIGEVLDVTGHLGGYNFQWAWSSGWCAGQYT